MIWILLFFGGSIVPPLTGIMLNSIKPELRSFANSNATMLINLLGYLPAPAVYGLLTTFNEKAGLFCITYTPIVCIFFLGYSLYCKY